MNMNDARKQIIKTIIELHNFFQIEWKKSNGYEIGKDDLWDINLLEVKPDRFYLVENLSEKSWDRENDTKEFEPKTEVRYLLRSKEAHAYGKGHQAFYDRYLSTIPFKNTAIENPQAYKEELLIELKRIKEKSTIEKK